MLQKSKHIFWSSRPVSWINTAFPFIASYWIITGKVSPTLIIGGLYFLIPYNLLMYGINDVFDYESDKLNPRKTGVQGIVLEKNLHTSVLWVAILTNVPFLVYLLIAGGTSANIVLAYVLFMVIAYSAPKLRFKERPLLDSFTSASHFAGPLLYGSVLGGWSADYLTFVISFMLWGMASHAFGAVQDVVPDRKAHIHSVATYIGAQRTVRISVSLYLLASLLLAYSGGSSLIVGIFGLLYAVNCLPYWSLTDKQSSEATDGWKRFMKLNYITGFVITILLLQLHVLS